MMLKYLHEAMQSGLAVQEGLAARPESEAKLHRQRAEAQFALAGRAIRMLKSLHIDIDALRVDESESFQGTGGCELGHEGVKVTIEWPNLALLADEAKLLLDEVAELDAPKVWFVLCGDGLEAYRYEADSREEAIRLCAAEHPGHTVHVAVRASAHGDMVLETYDEDIVRCPKCGSRTNFEDLPRAGWQAHACLGCGHAFIAVPDEAEVML